MLSITNAQSSPRMIIEFTVKRMYFIINFELSMEVFFRMNSTIVISMSVKVPGNMVMLFEVKYEEMNCELYWL